MRSSSDGVLAFEIDCSRVNVYEIASGRRLASRGFKRPVLAACFGRLEHASDTLMVSVSRGDGGCVLYALSAMSLEIVRRGVPLREAGTALAYVPGAACFAAGTVLGSLFMVEMTSSGPAVTQWRRANDAFSSDIQVSLDGPSFISSISLLDRIGLIAVGFSCGVCELWSISTQEVIDTLVPAASCVDGAAGVVAVFYIEMPDDFGRGGLFIVMEAVDIPSAPQLPLGHTPNACTPCIVQYYVEYEHMQFRKCVPQGLLDTINDALPASNLLGVQVLLEPGQEPDQLYSAIASRAAISFKPTSFEDPLLLWIIDYEKIRKGSIWHDEIGVDDPASEHPIALWVDRGSLSVEGTSERNINFTATLLTSSCKSYIADVASDPASILRDVEANPWALLSEDRLSETLDRCRQCLLDEDSSEIPRDATSKLRKMLDILVDRGASSITRYVTQLQANSSEFKQAFRLSNPRAVFEWALSTLDILRKSGLDLCRSLIESDVTSPSICINVNRLAAKCRALAGIFSSLETRGDSDSAGRERIASAFQLASLMAVALEFADLLYQMRLQAIPSALRDVEANPWALLSEDRLSETLDRCRQCLLDEDSSEIPVLH